MDGSGIESRRGRDFPHPSRTAQGLTQPPPVKWVPGLHGGEKQPTRGVDHALSSNTEVIEKVQLYV